MKAVLRFLAVFVPVILIIIIASYATQESDFLSKPTITYTPSPTVYVSNPDTFYDGVFAGCMAGVAANAGVVDNELGLQIADGCRAFTLDALSRDLYGLFYTVPTATPIVAGSDA